VTRPREKSVKARAITSSVLSVSLDGDVPAFIRNASTGYVVPQDSCATFRVTYQELEEFERDLHQHVHLENNILFPKAIDLERTLLSS
jgi:regulator of cell morphogenesis and NO signaling